MIDIIPLQLGVLPAPTAYDAIDVIDMPFEPVPKVLRRAVHERDGNTCRFCGFKSSKYQQVVAIKGSARDFDSIFTACIFCHQVVYLDTVFSMRSGILIWLPEVSQPDLHHIARELYRWRISPGVTQERANRILDRLKEREIGVRERVGSNDLHHFSARLKKHLHNSADSGLESVLSGIRLFPLDRRIVREVDLEFNQFPQILAYWRSRKGPFSDKTYNPGVIEIESILLLPSELESPSYSAK